MPTKIEIESQIASLGYKSRFGTRGEVNALPEILRENECLKAIVTGSYDGKMWLVVCTNHRVIFLDKGIIYGLKQVDFPLDKINSIQCETGLIFADIVIWDGVSKAIVKNIVKKEGKSFSDKVNEALVEHKTQGRPAIVVQPHVDVATQLTKLVELKDKGILTEQEFQDQKKKVLAA